MIDFMKYKWLYFFLSGVVVVPGVISLFVFGLRPGIDFTGGAVLELAFEEAKDAKPTVENLKDVLGKGGAPRSTIRSSGGDRFLIKMKPIGETEKEKIKELLGREFGRVEEVRFETVGPLLGKELLLKTLAAVVLASSFILFYVAYQFKDKMYGVCAIAAMFHDTLVLLGSFSLLGYFFRVEVDTLFVTAVLTILSFSVHDTVVVYDRIRESVKNFPRASFEGLVNKAVNETLIRSLNNSLTIIFMLVALIFLGGQTIRWFVTALLIGTISGTYSSTFTAAPLLVVWDRLSKKRRPK